MNPKLLVGIAVGSLAALLGVVVLMGPGDTEEQPAGPGMQHAGIDPLLVGLDGISIEEVSERAAIVRVGFDVSNPNDGLVRLQLVKYSLFYDGEKVHAGEIGERPGSFVVGSNYISVLPDRSVIVEDEIQFRNTGNNPEFWEALEDRTTEWSVQGEAHFSLSSMTVGGDNMVTFELSP
ncbi:hypothetical protein CENSYa_1533 [Cenarchaeum symbiosum A]|uniref:Water stress and hypersensitive response domain-containing protein n=1 Tax=Cenarchaeum symbiosum (strain A) TaxID=414004 RepID=A0RXT8_CENSY|nr:hypothetical protein CENSYa_1533 [Cenarchaeum symbiosum A]